MDLLQDMLDVGQLTHLYESIIILNRQNINDFILNYLNLIN